MQCIWMIKFSVEEAKGYALDMFWGFFSPETDKGDRGKKSSSQVKMTWRNDAVTAPLLIIKRRPPTKKASALAKPPPSEPVVQKSKRGD